MKDNIIMPSLLGVLDIGELENFLYDDKLIFNEEINTALVEIIELKKQERFDLKTKV